MKLSTGIIAGLALAAAASTASASTVIATVYEQYGYGNGGFDGVGSFVKANYNLSDVIINGTDYGALSKGSTTANTFIGDNESGFNSNFDVTVIQGGHTYSLSVPDLIGDADNSNPAIEVATISTFGAVPEPATWAMMILGVAGIGASLRGSRRLTQAV